MNTAYWIFLRYPCPNHVLTHPRFHRHYYFRSGVKRGCSHHCVGCLASYSDDDEDADCGCDCDYGDWRHVWSATRDAIHPFPNLYCYLESGPSLYHLHSAANHRNTPIARKLMISAYPADLPNEDVLMMLALLPQSSHPSLMNSIQMGQIPAVHWLPRPQQRQQRFLTIYHLLAMLKDYQDDLIAQGH